MPGPILKSVATLAEPFTPVIKSTLDEVISKLPDDWQMKEQSIPNALKKASNALTGKGLKDEEITMSGIIDLTSTAVITKKDLLARPRKDQFTQTTLKEGMTKFKDVTLKEFRSPTYEEKIRRFNLGGEKTRKIRSHFSNITINDEHYFTRRSVISLDDDKTSAKGRMVFEFQSDNQQRRKLVGGNLKENITIITKSMTKEKPLLAEEARLQNIFDTSTNKDELSFTENKLFLIHDELRQIRNKRIPAESADFEGIFNPTTPFTDNDWLTKAVEDELVDAELDGLKFIAVPLEVGSDDLVRGGGSAYIDRNTGKEVPSWGVQKWYETQVRDTLKKQVKTLNNGIKKRNSDAGPDQLFSYEEVKINRKGTKLILVTEERKSIDVLTLIDNMSSEDRQFFISSNSLDDNALFIAEELVRSGDVPNMEHAKVLANEQAIMVYFKALNSEQINKLVKETFGTTDKYTTKFSSHTLGKINLPVDKTPAILESRKGTAFIPTLERQSIVNYVSNSTVDELKIILSNIPELVDPLSSNSTRTIKNFWEPRAIEEVAGRQELRPGESATTFWDNAKLNDVGITRRKRTIMDLIEDLPPSEAERLSRVTGIKRLNAVPELSKVLPGWMDEMRLYGGAPATAAITSSLQEKSDFPVDVAAIKTDVQVAQDTKLRATVSKLLSNPDNQLTDENVLDFMVNTLGKDKVESKSVITNVMTTKIKGLLDQDIPANEIFDVLISKGYKAESLQNYFPSNEGLEDYYDDNLINFDVATSMVRNVLETITGVPLSEDSDTVEKLITRIDAANRTQLMTAVELGIPLTREMTIAAKNQSNALQIEIINELKEKGLPFQMSDDGEVMVQDSNGNYRDLDLSLLDMIIARRDETLGAFAGGYAGFKLGGKVPGPWPAKAAGAFVGTLVGSAGLTSVGRGTDILRNRIYNRQQIEGKFIQDEMIRTGAADGILTLMTAGVIKTGGTSWKLAKWAYDKVIAGNLNGGHRALLEYLHMTPEQAAKQVDAWARINPEGAKGLSRNQLRKEIEVLSRTDPLAFRVSQAASSIDSKAGINMAREINKRKTDLLKSVETGHTQERIGATIADALPEYEKRVENLYESTKTFAIANIKKPSVDPDTGAANIVYAFDYDKLVIEPTLRDAVEGIDNPAIRQQANLLFNKVRKIGGKEITISKGNNSELLLLKNKLEGLEKVSKEVKTKNIRDQIKDVQSQIKTLQEEEIITVNSRRSFSELLELREIVQQFGQKTGIKRPKDIAMIETLLQKVDKEITSAVRGHMEKDIANNWLKAWKKAKQGMDNLVQVRNNLLFKAIKSTGAAEGTIMNSLVKYSQSLDGTYREVMQALPIKLRAPTESALVRELINKATIGPSTSLQAIDFVKLEKSLKHIPMSTEGNKKYKQAIGEMARVYKNDPHLLAASGTVKKDAFASYLTDDPIIRVKYATVSFFFNYIKRLLPGEGGRKAAMLTHLAKVLKAPHDSQLVDDLVKMLPPDPAARNEMRRLAAEVADANAKSNFPKVEVYSVAPSGDTLKATSGQLGKGRYLYLNKTRARTASRASSGKLTKELILPDRIADDVIIKNTLGLSQDSKLTSEMIRRNHKLKEKLEQQGYSGIIVNDQIMLF